MRSQDRNQYLAEVLAFAHNKDLHEKLAARDKNLANEVTKFHVKITIAEGVAIMMEENATKIEIMKLKDTINQHLFHSSGILHEIEDRIQTYLPTMLSEGWLDKDLRLTDYGRLVISYKKVSFFKNNNLKDFLS